MNVQHDCYSCKCTGIWHCAVQQECEKTSKTQDLVDHSSWPWFVLNVHSIHNYKSILAPLDIWKPLSLDVNIVALRKRAAQLIQKEHTDVDIAHPTDTDELTSSSIPFDQICRKTQAVPQCYNKWLSHIKFSFLTIWCVLWGGSHMTDTCLLIIHPGGSHMTPPVPLSLVHITTHRWLPPSTLLWLSTRSLLFVFPIVLPRYISQACWVASSLRLDFFHCTTVLW